jgi:branched-chain amino acid aminotransferase
MVKEDYINYNGNLFLRLNVNLGLNRAMRFGDGVFETIRIIDGELVWWQEHFERLIKGLKYLYLDVPELFLDELLVDCLATLHRNEIEKGGILRVFVYRKGSRGYTPTTYDFDYVIETEELEVNQFKLNPKGLVIGISETVTLNSREEQSYKTLNKIPYIRAAAEKVNKGLDEILILNEKGFIAEASSSNVFLLIDHVFYATSDSNGALNGISQNKVIEIIKKKKQKLVCQNLTREMLVSAQEVFLTNSVSGIRWISSYEKSRYFHTHSSNIISKLMLKN